MSGGVCDAERRGVPRRQGQEPVPLRARAGPQQAGASALQVRAAPGSLSSMCPMPLPCNLLPGATGIGRFKRNPPEQGRCTAVLWRLCVCLVMRAGAGGT